MENSGLLNRLSSATNTKYLLVKLAPQTKEQLLVDENDTILLGLLKEVVKVQEVASFLNAEKVILKIELSEGANSAEEINSIKAGLKQLDDAERSFQIVLEPSVYKSATGTYPDKSVSMGFPLMPRMIFSIAMRHALQIALQGLQQYCIKICSVNAKKISKSLEKST